MIIDRPPLPDLQDSIDVHAPRVDNGEQRGDGETTRGEDADSIGGRDKVEKSDRHASKQDCKVRPLCVNCRYST